jgi:uncharacterized membrane protein YkvA (DUF1232 family)
MSEWLVSLPHDLKLLYEAAADENIERKSRELAVGAIIYVVSPNDYISADRHDSFVSYADDCILLRMALKRVVAAENEDTEFFRSRFTEFFESVDAELAVAKGYMGELYDWLESRVDTLTALEYKGKKIKDYLDDDEASEFLYEDGLGFRTEYDVDEETLSDSFKKATAVMQMIQRRKDEEDQKVS